MFIYRTEEEIGAEIITSLTVPDNLVGKFEKMDAAYLADEIAEADSQTDTKQK